MRFTKIKDNKMLPDWYFESPVIVTYPVRGHKDMGDMTPNEFFPYTNGLKYIDKYNNGRSRHVHDGLQQCAAT